MVAWIQLGVRALADRGLDSPFLIGQHAPGKCRDRQQKVTLSRRVTGGMHRRERVLSPHYDNYMSAGHSPTAAFDEEVTKKKTCRISRRSDEEVTKVGAAKTDTATF